jgi:hypothetical protein
MPLTDLGGKGYSPSFAERLEKELQINNMAALE